jgi:hypothetical protein
VCAEALDVLDPDLDRAATGIRLLLHRHRVREVGRAAVSHHPPESQPRNFNWALWGLPEFTGGPGYRTNY